MLTTLYCDASFCPKLQVGGWAIWLRSDRGRIVENGVIPAYCKHAFEAELAAIYAGVYRATQRWPDTEAVLIRSDCEQALGLVTGSRTAKERFQGAHELIRKIRVHHQESQVRLITKWVKGHGKQARVDTYLNNRVDALARSIMEKERLIRGMNPS